MFDGGIMLGQNYAWSKNVESRRKRNFPPFEAEIPTTKLENRPAVVENDVTRTRAFPFVNAASQKCQDTYAAFLMRRANRLLWRQTFLHRPSVVFLAKMKILDVQGAVASVNTGMQSEDWKFPL